MGGRLAKGDAGGRLRPGVYAWRMRASLVIELLAATVGPRDPASGVEWAGTGKWAWGGECEVDWASETATRTVGGGKRLGLAQTRLHLQLRDVGQVSPHRCLRLALAVQSVFPAAAHNQSSRPPLGETAASYNRP